MDEQRREIFMEELKEAVQQRDELDTYIVVLAHRLGIDPPGRGADTSEPDIPAAGTATGDPVSAVAEGEFYGLSGPKASKKLLEKFGRSRPMKTAEIFDAITKGGVKLGGPATLYRSLTRDPDFHKVGRSLWGLSEWYPPAAKQKDSESPDENGDLEPTDEDSQDETEETGADTE